MATIQGAIDEVVVTEVGVVGKNLVVRAIVIGSMNVSLSTKTVS
jgi:hypothetical protein